MGPLITALSPSNFFQVSQQTSGGTRGNIVVEHQLIVWIV